MEQKNITENFLSSDFEEMLFYLYQNWNFLVVRSISIQLQSLSMRFLFI